MRVIKHAAVVFSLGFLLVASNGNADQWNHLTKVTFSGPVQVANTQLPAGTYVFKLMDDEGDRNIVQIYNADETHLITTVLAMPDYRLKPTSSTAVKFAESSNGTEASGNVPETGLPIKEWFYPGDSFGQEFRVVPAKVVAEAQPAPAVAAAEPAPAPAPAAEPAPEPAPAAPAVATPAQEPAPAPQAAPAPAQTDQTAVTSDQKTEPSELPKTASEMPLVGLFGLLSLAGAASLRILLKVTA